MKNMLRWLRGLGAVVCLAAAGAAAAGASDSCEREAKWTSSGTTRHFLSLAASRGVFYDGSGPSFIMLMKWDTATDEVEMGAVGVHSDDKRRAVFGAVPWQQYDAFLQDPKDDAPNVLLRMEINGPQYERVLEVLRSWERRARENELLYTGDVHMNNILFVRQATDELNRCGERVNLYQLDWGIHDRISDENPTSHVARLVFEELKRRNASLHVPDSKMPGALLALAGSEPLPARVPAVAKKAVAHKPAAEAHAHHHHDHASEAAKP
jgi:hypothetical protein